MSPEIRGFTDPIITKKIICSNKIWEQFELLNYPYLKNSQNFIYLDDFLFFWNQHKRKHKIAKKLIQKVAENNFEKKIWKKLFTSQKSYFRAKYFCVPRNDLEWPKTSENHIQLFILSGGVCAAVLRK